jgi:ribosomal protein L29
MTKKAHADLVKKTPEELEKELAKAHEELLKLNAQVATGGAAKEAGKIVMLKRKVARIRTLQNSIGGAAAK